MSADNNTKNPPRSSTNSTSSSSSSASADKKSSASPRKIIQFNRVTKEYLVPCIDDLTDEEFGSLWPTEEDNQRSQQHLVETLRALQLNGGEVPRHLQGQITSRGVESFLASINLDPNSMDHPITRKNRHTSSVLDCQDLTTCPEAIARESQITSQEARNRALDLANSLERELRIDGGE